MYLFTVAMRGGSTTATTTVPDVDRARVEVIGEDRTNAAASENWHDPFSVYQVHLYRVREERASP